ncbi:MAG TPA: hypothetical protein VJU77_14185 [Chthoniobacterales bacterium]|nr:hypothetical protein [Chthoniobacterales bacterium]
MNSNNALSYVALSLLLGAIGQVARMVIGLKKTSDEAQAKNIPFSACFDGKQLMVSLILGAVAGGLASIAMWDNPVFNKQTVMILITAGYAGADFIEGFMRKESGGPKTTSTPAGPTGSTLAPVNPFDHT